MTFTHLPEVKLSYVYMMAHLRVNPTVRLKKKQWRLAMYDWGSKEFKKSNCRKKLEKHPI